MIKKRILQPFVSMSVGNQINLNHEGCGAGTDTKKRLYIKRVVGGVVAYCHHCSDKGFYRELSPDGTSLRKWLTGKSDAETYDIERNSAYSVWNISTNEFNANALSWLSTYDLLPNNTEYYRSSIRGNIVMGLRTEKNELFGIQVRRFDTVRQPKYTTYLRQKTSYDSAFFLQDTSRKVLVITEDYTSAYRVWRDTNIPSLALLKTSMSAFTQDLVTTLFQDKIIYLWLDPDEAGNKATKILTQRLKYLSTSTTKILPLYMTQEPKAHTPHDLKDILDGL